MRPSLVAIVAAPACLSGDGPARAAEGSNTVALEGLSLRRGSLTILVPHLEALGTALTAGGLRDILDPSSPLSAAQRQAALLADARFEALSATVVDRDLRGRALAVSARQAGTTPAQVRAGLEARIAAGLPDLLGRSTREAAVAAALGRFLDVGGTLTLAARSPAGITSHEMGEAADPSAIPGRLDISAQTHP